jgi:hypothetical protein
LLVVKVELKLSGNRAREKTGQRQKSSPFAHPGTTLPIKPPEAHI